MADTDASLPARRGLALLLTDHHRRLQTKCHEMLEWAHTDDARDLASSWSELETELLDHMAAEEEVILPSYAEHDPEDARRIRDDHERVRALVSPMGLDIELHQIRLARLRSLVAAIASHSAVEDATMYPWAARNVGLVSERLFFSEIGRWVDRA